MGGKLLKEDERKYEIYAGVGVVIKAWHDARKAVEGVTKLPPQPEDRKDKRWNKGAQRYRYRAKMVIEIKGKKTKVGGRFTAAPEDAPPWRKRKKK